MLEKIVGANVEFSMGQEKEWREGESSKLTAMKEEAKAEIRKESDRQSH